MFYSLAKEDSKKMSSLFKLVCHVEPGSPDEKIVGCHCIGKSADEMIQLISISMNMGATKKDFDRTVAVHPTASEEFVLMDPKLY
jgi:glutathione reductase (NADPH)